MEKISGQPYPHPKFARNEVLRFPRPIRFPPPKSDLHGARRQPQPSQRRPGLRLLVRGYERRAYQLEIQEHPIHGYEFGQHRMPEFLPARRQVCAHHLAGVITSSGRSTRRPPSSSRKVAASSMARMLSTLPMGWSSRAAADSFGVGFAASRVAAAGTAV